MRLRTAGPILALTSFLAVTLTRCAIATKAPPVANAGTDITVHVGESVSYDGSHSVDLDAGKIVYYHWRVTGAPEGREDEIGRVLREGEDAAVWTTDAVMAKQDLGQWIVELTVTDDEGQSATDDLTLTVVP